MVVLPVPEGVSLAEALAEHTERVELGVPRGG